MLDSIALKLSDHAEKYQLDEISEATYAFAVHDLLNDRLPTPSAPAHVEVLKRLKDWHEALLITPEQLGACRERVVAASKSSSASASVYQPRSSGAASSGAPPPTAEQLEFKNAASQSLVGKCILFNWATAGWCLGEITRTNIDGRRIVEKGVPANFFVYYEIDEDESKHKLDLEEHGHQEVPGAWVLLEKEA